jgi:hypothetical protein
MMKNREMFHGGIDVCNTLNNLYGNDSKIFLISSASIGSSFFLMDFRHFILLLNFDSPVQI